MPECICFGPIPGLFGCCVGVFQILVAAPSTLVGGYINGQTACSPWGCNKIPPISAKKACRRVHCEYPRLRNRFTDRQGRGILGPMATEKDWLGTYNGPKTSISPSFLEPEVCSVYRYTRPNLRPRRPLIRGGKDSRGP